MAQDRESEISASREGPRVFVPQGKGYNNDWPSTLTETLEEPWAPPVFSELGSLSIWIDQLSW